MGTGGQIAALSSHFSTALSYIISNVPSSDRQNFSERARQRLSHGFDSLYPVKCSSNPKGHQNVGLKHSLWFSGHRRGTGLYSQVWQFYQ